MKPFRLSFTLVVLTAVVVFVGTGISSGQSLSWTLHGASDATTVLGTDLLKVNYFSNANTTSAPDGTVRITNPGSPTGNLCAQIYVFDPEQELSECCACLVTPDGLRTLSVNTDLTKNPLTPVTLTTGSVSIVSGYTSGKSCSPINDVVSPTIRAWGTHIQSDSSGYSITETEYSDRALGEYNDNLLIACYGILLDGSGHGVCTCGSGD
jgi:hypothetical protein